MVKKVLIFIAGVVTGMLLTIAFGYFIAVMKSDDYGITFLDTEGECVSSKSFRVRQVLSSGNALAEEVNSIHSIGSDLTVLFYNDGTKTYYDNQIIKIPDGKCAKQIGTFQYTTKVGLNKTVPVVEILDK